MAKKSSTTRPATSRYLKRRIEPIDPVRTGSISELLMALEKCSFQGRMLSECLYVWEQMSRDPQCVKVLSIAGAMVPAGMGTVFERLMEHRLIDAIVCTGATISHDLCNGIDPQLQAHYVGSEYEDDEKLRDEAINRIYDTYLPETGFHSAEVGLLKVIPQLKWGIAGGKVKTITTQSFLAQVGKLWPGRCLTRRAAELGVPIFVPAVSDSEMALNVVVANLAAKKKSLPRIVFDTLGDVEAFGELILTKPRAGLVTLGGGVPRNWAQQVYPYLQMKARVANLQADGYHYGVRITTDRPEFGGLSGCTLSESKSWGKYELKAVATSVVCDSTIALPILVRALLERLGKV